MFLHVTYSNQCGHQSGHFWYFNREHLATNQKSYFKRYDQTFGTTLCYSFCIFCVTMPLTVDMYSYLLSRTVRNKYIVSMWNFIRIHQVSMCDMAADTHTHSSTHTEGKNISLAIPSGSINITAPNMSSSSPSPSPSSSLLLWFLFF